MATIRKRTWETRKGTTTAYVVAYYDRHGRQRNRQFRKLEDAKSYLKEVVSELHAGVHIAPSASITVAEAVDVWLRACQLGGESDPVQPATLDQYQWAARCWILPKLGHRRLVDLTALDLIEFRDSLLRSHLPRNSAQKNLQGPKDHAARGETARQSKQGFLVGGDDPRWPTTERQSDNSDSF